MTSLTNTKLSYTTQVLYTMLEVEASRQSLLTSTFAGRSLASS